jgi:MFS transporter, ACS family, tartrate transporter
MSSELRLSSQDLGMGMGIFFLGYMLFDIPGSLAVETRGARRWLSTIMISWGIAASMTGLVHTKRNLLIVRFLLGVCEAGFFPGVAAYLSHWFVERDKAKAIAAFMIAVPLSYVFGGPLSELLLGVHWLGLTGWRWMFLMEGLPAVIMGIAVLFILDNRPADANWLNPMERQALQEAIDRDRAGKPRRMAAFEYLRDSKVWLLSGALFMSALGAYGFGLWLPTILAGMPGISRFTLVALASSPYAVSVAAMVLVGWHSDRSDERRWHTALPLLVAAIGLSLGLRPLRNVPETFAVLCVAGLGIYSYLPSFWSLPTQYFSNTAAAVSLGFVGTIGSLGGLAGPYLVGYAKQRTGSFQWAMAVLLVAMILSAVFTLALPSRRGRTDPAQERTN